MQKREIIIKSATSGGSVSFTQRKVQKSFYGFICPITTPEGGANIGRYLSPTILSYITVPQDADKITDYIVHHKLFKKVMEENKFYFSVKINFLTIGFVEDGATFKEFYNDLLKWRREHAFVGKNHKSFQQDADQLFVSIYYSVENGEINISTDSGRIMVPIFTAEIAAKKLKKDMRQMLIDGDAMYICPQMAQNFVVGEYGR